MLIFRGVYVLYLIMEEVDSNGKKQGFQPFELRRIFDLKPQESFKNDTEKRSDQQRFEYSTQKVNSLELPILSKTKSVMTNGASRHRILKVVPKTSSYTSNIFGIFTYMKNHKQSTIHVPRHSMYGIFTNMYHRNSPFM